MLACTALVGCNSSDDIVNNNENNDGLKNYVTKINLNFPDVNSGSRAGGYNPDTDGEPEYANGDKSEYEVSSITVRFYDSQKNALGESTTVEWDEVNSQPDHVTRTGVVSFRSVTQPYYAVVFVNDPNTGDAFSSQGIDNMKEVTLDDTTYPMSTVAKANNFFMTNASWLNGKAIVQEVNISDATEEVDETTSLEEALAKITTPADIYVERVVSKVQLGIDLDNNAVGNDGLYQIKYKTTGEEEGDDSPYAIKIEAWGLNATNKTFYPMKKIENTWDASWSITGRSFWAIDPNYNSTTDEYLTAEDFNSATLPTACLNYYKLDEVGAENNTNYSMAFDNANQANNILYCYENTYDPTKVTTNSAATHVVMKAGYYEQGTDGTWAKPTGDYIYRINQVIFNEANMKARISAVLLSKYDFYKGETKLSDLANSINLTVDGKTAVTTISLAEGITVTAIGDKNATQTITNWNDKFNGGTIIGYKGGVCYYTIPIKHFSNAAEGQVGHYGVVRNHWYILTVTSIAGFGEPGTVNPIIPEEDEKLRDWVVKCNININAWAKVSQGDITVGGGTDVWD